MVSFDKISHATDTLGLMKYLIYFEQIFSEKDKSKTQRMFDYMTSYFKYFSLITINTSNILSLNRVRWMGNNAYFFVEYRSDLESESDDQIGVFNLVIRLRE